MSITTLVPCGRGERSLGQEWRLPMSTPDSHLCVVRTTCASTLTRFSRGTTREPAKATATPQWPAASDAANRSARKELLMPKHESVWITTSEPSDFSALEDAIDVDVAVLGAG